MCTACRSRKPSTSRTTSPSCRRLPLVLAAFALLQSSLFFLLSDRVVVVNQDIVVAGIHRIATARRLHMETVAQLLRSQFPQNCTFPDSRFVHIDKLYTRAGFGSGMIFYRSCLVLALESNRTLLPLEGGTRLGSYLLPWSNCTLEDAEVVVANSGRDAEEVVMTCDPTKHNRMGASNPPPSFRSFGDKLWFDLHALGFLARPSDDMRSLFPVRNKTFVSNTNSNLLVGAHVRRGDKKNEAAPVPSEYYLSDLESALIRDISSNEKEVQYINDGQKEVELRVFTDEPNTIRGEMQVAAGLPHRRVRFRIFINGEEIDSLQESSIKRSWNAINSEQGDGERNDLAMLLMTMSSSDPIAVTLTSNLGWLVMAMKVYRDLEIGTSSGTLVAVNPNSWSGLLVPDERNILGANLFWSQAKCSGPNVGQLGKHRSYEESRGYNLPCTTRPSIVTYSPVRMRKGPIIAI